jgi:hypothetical protein
MICACAINDINHQKKKKKKLILIDDEGGTKVKVFVVRTSTSTKSYSKHGTKKAAEADAEPLYQT